MSIQVTDAAARHIQRILEKRGSGIGLRVAVKAAGCSGLAYAVEVADEIGEFDLSFETNGIRVVVDPKSHSLIDGVEVDFVRQGLSEGFKFSNPNAKGTCGCGDSFAV